MKSSTASAESRTLTTIIKKCPTFLRKAYWDSLRAGRPPSCAPLSTRVADWAEGVSSATPPANSVVFLTTGNSIRSKSQHPGIMLTNRGERTGEHTESGQSGPRNVVDWVSDPRARGGLSGSPLPVSRWARSIVLQALRPGWLTTNLSSRPVLGLAAARLGGYETGSGESVSKPSPSHPVG